MNGVKVSAAVVAMLIAGHSLACAQDRAESDFAASLRLRGGFDTNPVFANGAGVPGSAFIATDTALAGGMKTDAYTIGATVEADTVHYAEPLYAPTVHEKLVLRGTTDIAGVALRSESVIDDTDSYNLRFSDVSQTVKGEYKFDGLKLFTTAEVGRTSLNQTNAIFDDFLPVPLQFYRAVLVPGVSVTHRGFEAGASINLSVRRYTETLDLFGYRRDNERVQPFIFASYEGKAITAFAAVSRLIGTWHDVDFSPVQRTLFEGNFKYQIAPFGVELKISRRAGETSFPISPITIDSTYTAKASWQAAPKLVLSAGVGYVTTEYLDSPFSARTQTYGLGASYALASDISLGVDLSYADGTLISGDPAHGIITSVSLTKRFTHANDDLKKKFAADVLPPQALSVGTISERFPDRAGEILPL